MSNFGKVLLVLTLVIVSLPFAHFFVAGAGNERYEEPKGWKEDIFCMNAVCVKNKDDTETCLEFPPQVARVILVPEAVPSNENRMSVSLLGKSCVVNK